MSNIRKIVLVTIMIAVISTPTVAFGQNTNSKLKTYWEKTLYKYGIIKEIQPVFPDVVEDTKQVTTTPKITDISPRATSAGKVVNITGTGFLGLSPSDIVFKNTSNTVNISYANISKNKITFLVPNTKNGTYDVSLVGKGGVSNTVKFTVSQSASPTVNNTRKTNTNYNYVNTQSGMPVYEDFEQPEAQYINQNRVRNNNAYVNQDAPEEYQSETPNDEYESQDDEYELQDEVYVFPPRIVRINPLNAKVGDTVEIIGVNFGGSNPEVQLIFNNQVLNTPRIISSNANKISFKVPELPTGQYKIVFKVGGNVSNGVTFNLLGSSVTQRVIVPTPTVVESPVVTAPVVTTPVVEPTPTLVPAPVPVTSPVLPSPQPPASVAPIVVETNPTPKILSISPSSAMFGNTVTLSGTNLEGAVSDLMFMDNSTGSINPEIISASATSITFKVPNVPAGIYKVYLFADKGESNQVELKVYIPSGVQTTTQSDLSSNVFDWFLGLFQ